MKKRKVTIIVLSIIGVMMFHSVGLATEAFFTNPGTRAMSLSGAFSAQADDSTAIWYNPAGLRQFTPQPGDVTVEGGSVPSISESGEYNTKEIKLKYVGIAGAGFGLAYYEPYKISVSIPEKVAPTDSMPIGRVDVDFEQISVAGAGQLGDRLSLGIAIDILASSVEAKNYGGNIGGLSGYGGDIGALYKLATYDNFKIKAGLVYRSKITYSYSDKSDSATQSNTVKAGDIIKQYLPARPESRGVGLNVQFPISTVLMNVNVGYEQTLWSQAYSSKVDASGSDYTKMMIGIEAKIPFFDAVPIFLRIGKSKATPADTTKYSTIDSFTFGWGLAFVEHIGLDFAAENKSFSGDSKTYTLHSVSASYQW